MPSLETILAGIKLKNPTMNASGVLFTQASLLYRLQKNGVGALVTKSNTKNSKPGNKGPTVLQFTEDVWMNRMGLPNPGIDYSTKELKEYSWQVPLIVSIAGSSEKEYVHNAKIGSSIGDIAEINLSCPNVKGGTICFDLNQTSEIMKSLSNKIDIPIFAKLSPYTDIKKLKDTIDVLYSSNIDGITLTNTAPALNIISTIVEVNENKSNNLFKGGLSSNALFPISLRNVYEASKYIEKERLELDVIGVGGIETSDEMIKYIMCGANAIQFGSAAVNYFDDHWSIPRKLCDGLNKYMEEKNLNSIEDLRGIVYQ